MIRALVVATLFLSGSAWSAPTLAVAYFDNNSGATQFDPLRKGLADMLITDLLGVAGVQVVEREKLNVIMDELKLSQSKAIDKSSALKMGKVLAAQYVLTGSMTVSNEALRIDAKILKTADGSVVSSDKVEGLKTDFFAVEKDLVDVLVRVLQLKLSPDEKSKLRRNPTQSFEAWSTYSRALDAKDNGRDDEARKLFAAAIEADPNYAAAKTGLERMGALQNVARTQNADRADSALAKLNPKNKTFGKDVYDLTSVPGADARGVAQQIALFRLLVERNWRPVYGEGPSAIFPETIALESLAMRYVWDPETVELLPVVPEYLLRKYPEDRLLTASNMAQDPETIQKQIALKKKNPALMYEQFEKNTWNAAHLANRAAAQELFRLIASKLPKK
jgi:TolB-like protein